MDLPRNRFKHALLGGRQQLGLWCSLSHHYSLEVVAGAAFDWLLLDMEHSPNDLESLLSQLQAVAAYAPSAVVRVPWNDTVAIKRVLDVGAQTLLIPYVQNVEEARAAVAATRYPPEGVRGVAGSTRATRFGRVSGYARRAHELDLVVLYSDMRRDQLVPVQRLLDDEALITGVLEYELSVATVAGWEGLTVTSCAVEDLVVPPVDGAPDGRSPFKVLHFVLLIHHREEITP
jgi:4-hydroxy-2-oxoheptanedioate aldolase